MIRPSVTPGEAWLAAGLERVGSELERRLAGLAALSLMTPTPGPSGKLLRPRLLLSLAAAPGLEGEARAMERAVSLAAAVELIHLATLHHDDVLDDSPHRRRSESARQIFGNKVSILFGDALLAAALDALLGSASRPMQFAVAQAVTATLRGEIAQHLGHRTMELEEVDCIRVASRKTGSLFGLAAQLGVLLRGAGRQSAVAAYRLGRRLGTAFQLIDDALDYAGTEDLLGKPPGADYRQGIATLPLVRAWRGAGDRERRVLEAGFGADGRSDFAAVREIVLWPEHFEPCLAAARRLLALAQSSMPSLDLNGNATLLTEYFGEIERRIPLSTHATPVPESIA